MIIEREKKLAEDISIKDKVITIIFVGDSEAYGRISWEEIAYKNIICETDITEIEKILKSQEGGDIIIIWDFYFQIITPINLNMLEINKIIDLLENNIEHKPIHIGLCDGILTIVRRIAIIGDKFKVITNFSDMPKAIEAVITH